MHKNKILKSAKKVPETTISDYAISEDFRDNISFVSEFLFFEDSLNKVQCRADSAVDYTRSKSFESLRIERQSMNCKIQYKAAATVNYTTSELSLIETCLIEEDSKTQYRPEIEADYPIFQPSDNLSNPLTSRNSGKNKPRKRKADSGIPVSSARDSIFAAADPTKRKRIAHPNGRVTEGTVKFESSYNGHFAELVKDLTAVSLCDELMALEAITDEEYETVRSHSTNKERNRTLLLILSRKRVSKSKFTLALRRSGNSHLVPMFFSK